ncbi:MAG: winged helix-turn-helix domain-containing protein, partial [Acidimicrobiia bacterium]
LRPEVGRLGLLVRALGDHLAPRRSVYQLAGHEVLVQGCAIEVDGAKAELAPRERAVFEALRETEGAYLTRPYLLTRVWGSADTDSHLLEVTIGRLRRRLGPAGSAIEAKPGRGYRLAVEPG